MTPALASAFVLVGNCGCADMRETPSIDAFRHTDCLRTNVYILTSRGDDRDLLELESSSAYYLYEIC
jgi:hypothetical protein